jgi:RNA polymerase sigma factor (sigma-70 family)
MKDTGLLPTDNLALESRSRVDRCVRLLQEDYHRQSEHLHPDDVSRLLSRLSLSPNESIWVWASLAQTGIDVEGLEVREESTKGLGNVIRPNDAESTNGRPELSYGFHQLLSHEQEIQLGRRVRTGRDVASSHFGAPNEETQRQLVASGQAARAQLVLSNIRLVIHYAKHHAKLTTIPMEDLVQDGIIGLFRAIDKYDPERGFRFSTYASWWVNQSISRSIVSTGRTVRIPNHMLARLVRLQRKQRRLGNRLHRHPTSKELADELGWDVSDVELLLQIQLDTYSLDSDQGKIESNRNTRWFQSAPESPSAELERRELGRIVEHVLATLDKRSRRVLTLRFGLLGNKPRTLEQIGKSFKLTRERIRQIEKKALERLEARPRGELLRQFTAFAD